MDTSLRMSSIQILYLRETCTKYTTLHIGFQSSFHPLKCTLRFLLLLVATMEIFHLEKQAQLVLVLILVYNGDFHLRSTTHPMHSSSECLPYRFSPSDKHDYSYSSSDWLSKVLSAQENISKGFLPQSNIHKNFLPQRNIPKSYFSNVQGLFNLSRKHPKDTSLRVTSIQTFYLRETCLKHTSPQICFHGDLSIPQEWAPKFTQIGFPMDFTSQSVLIKMQFSLESILLGLSPLQIAPKITSQSGFDKDIPTQGNIPERYFSDWLLNRLFPLEMVPSDTSTQFEFNRDFLYQRNMPKSYLFSDWLLEGIFTSGKCSKMIFLLRLTLKCLFPHKIIPKEFDTSWSITSAQNVS